MALMMRVRVNRGIEQKQRDINASQYYSNKASEKKRMEGAFYKYDALNRTVVLYSQTLRAALLLPEQDRRCASGILS